MSWMTRAAQDANGWYYRITKSYGALTNAQKETNAELFYRYFSDKMTLAAIAGILGNIERESQLNPGQVEGDSSHNIGWSDLQRGHGFIQWTNSKSPDSNPLVSWKDGSINDKWAQGNFQCYRIYCEGEEIEGAGGCWLKNPSKGYTYTWKEFCELTDYEEATKAYLHERERAGVSALQERLDNAKKWYRFLWKKFFARLDDSDTSVLTNKYWVSRLNNRGGLNYNKAIEDWLNAQSGWTTADQNSIKGTGTTLPNCTSWAWGRAYEIMGNPPPRFTGDAGNWWHSFDVLNKDNTLTDLGYSKSTTTPAFGAIACWRNPNDHDSMGHVAIVEDIYDDGSISFSESGYRTWVWRPGYFNVQINKNPTKVYTKYEFVGYIHLPLFKSTITPLPVIESFEFIKAETEEASFKISIENNGSIIDRVYYTLNNNVVRDLDILHGENTFSVEKLVPNTENKIIISIDSGSTTITSNIILFTTKQDYPDPIKNIIINSTGKNLENIDFEVNIEKPSRWGYWQRIGNDSGYRVYIIGNYNLLENYDDEQKNNKFLIVPNQYSIQHEDNLQIGISTWVTDNEGNKVFAQPGDLYPVCSNSIFLKDISEVPDTCFFTSDNLLNKVQPFMKDNLLNTFKPINIFKL